MTETNRLGSWLPRDCHLHPLTTRPDSRGDLTEMFRAEWFDSPPPRVWHVMRGRANGLSGIRVHARDWLYLCLLDGAVWISLKDLRAQAGDQIVTAQLVLSDSPRQACVIAPGIAHGLYFPQATTYLLGRVEDTDPAEHLLCGWDNTDMVWPDIAPELAPSDRGGRSFAEFKAEFIVLLRSCGDA